MYRLWSYDHFLWLRKSSIFYKLKKKIIIIIIDQLRI